MYICIFYRMALKVKIITLFQLLEMGAEIVLMGYELSLYEAGLALIQHSRCFSENLQE